MVCSAIQESSIWSLKIWQENDWYLCTFIVTDQIQIWNVTCVVFFCFSILSLSETSCMVRKLLYQMKPYEKFYWIGHNLNLQVLIFPSFFDFLVFFHLILSPSLFFFLFGWSIVFFLQIAAYSKSVDDCECDSWVIVCLGLRAVSLLFLRYFFSPLCILAWKI